MVRKSTVKTMKIGPLENFPLYGKLLLVSCAKTINDRVASGKPSCSKRSCHSVTSLTGARKGTNVSHFLDRQEYIVVYAISVLFEH